MAQCSVSISFLALIYILSAIGPGNGLCAAAAAWPNSTFATTKASSNTTSSNSTSGSSTVTHAFGYYTAAGIAATSMTTLTTPSDTSSPRLRSTQSSLLNSNSSWPSYVPSSTLSSVSSTSTVRNVGYYVAAGLGLSRPSILQSTFRSTGSSSIQSSRSSTDYSNGSNATLQGNDSLITHNGFLSTSAAPMVTGSVVAPSHSFTLIAPPTSLTRVTNSTLDWAQRPMNSSSGALGLTKAYNASSAGSSRPTFITQDSWSMLPNGSIVEVVESHARPNVTDWRTVSNDGQCWTEWLSYWSLKPFANYSMQGTGWKTGTVTSTETSYSLSSIWESGQSTFTWTNIKTTTQWDGLFAATTLTSASTLTTTYTDGWNPVSVEILEVTVAVQKEERIMETAVLATPKCRLPSLYPSCQSQWEQYLSTQVLQIPALGSSCTWNASYLPSCFTAQQSVAASMVALQYNAPVPTCSQASISGALCSSWVSNFVTGTYSTQNAVWNDKYMVSYGWQQSNGSWMWPSKSHIAPGCTLGCARCAITGGTIQLLYFQPGLSHPATDEVVAVTFGTTLTSPTYYLFFASVFASDSCSGIGTTKTSLIVPIPTNEPLSSLWGTYWPCLSPTTWWSTQNDVLTSTASFNISDLLSAPNSVPYSIYSSQLYCASMISSNGCGADSCPTTLSYNPIIVVPNAVLTAIDPAWASCSADLRGLYDPPRALQPATVAAGPSLTAADQPFTISATPGSGLSSDTPTSTPKPASSSLQDTTPATALPFSLQSLQSSSALVDPVSQLSSAATVQPSFMSPSQPQSQQGSSHSPGISSSADSSAALNALDILSAAESSAHLQTKTSDTTTGSTFDEHSLPLPISSIVQTGASYPASETVVVSFSQTLHTPHTQNSGAVPGQAGANVVPTDRVTSTARLASVEEKQSTMSALGQSGGDGGMANIPHPASTATGFTRSNPVPAVAPHATSPASGSPTNTVALGSPLVLGTKTLLPGQILTLSGVTLTQPGLDLVLDGTRTVKIANVAGQTLLTLGSLTVLATLGRPLVVGSSTLFPEGPAATISGEVISMAVSAIFVVGGTSKLSFVGDPAAASETVFTLGSSTFTATASLPLVVGTVTLSSGGQALAVDGGGRIITQSGTILIVDGTSIPHVVAPPVRTIPASSEAPLISVLTAVSASSGTPVSAAADSADTPLPTKKSNALPRFAIGGLWKFAACVSVLLGLHVLQLG